VRVVGEGFFEDWAAGVIVIVVVVVGVEIVGSWRAAGWGWAALTLHCAVDVGVK